MRKRYEDYEADCAEVLLVEENSSILHILKGENYGSSFVEHIKYDYKEEPDED